MKIYIIPVPSAFQPEQQPFVYPPHNGDFYGVEQDFLNYLSQHSELIVASRDAADWAYLPIFWTHWHLEHSYATSGLVELQGAVDKALEGRSNRTFTVCQYDDGPQIDVGAMITLVGTATTARDVNIPLLCKHHAPASVSKRYTASFIGRLSTNALRGEMARALSHRTDVRIQDGNHGEGAFVELLLESRIALCPRGHGASSFRFYEAMQLGVVPLLIGDVDARPFKRVLDWDGCSFYAESVERVESTFAAFASVHDDERVSEVIISDDGSTSLTLDRLRRCAAGFAKVRVFGNDQNYGSYLNKKRAIEASKAPWVALIDSDNVISTDYVNTIFALLKWDCDTVYAPVFGHPALNYTAYAGLVVTKENISDYLGKPGFLMAMNTGNFFVHRESYISVAQGGENVLAADVLYFLYRWLASGRRVLLTPGLAYEHAIHHGHWMQTAERSEVIVRGIVHEMREDRWAHAD